MVKITTSYDVLYAGLMSKVRDYEWMSLSDDEIKGILHDYLRPAIVRFPYCRQNLSNRTDNNDGTGQFNIELTDTEIEILVDYMVIVWLDSNFVRTTVALKQSMPSTDYQMWSPGNWIGKLVELHGRLLREVDTLKTVYSHESQRANIAAAVRNPNRHSTITSVRGRWW